ncbi:gluconate 2-dehydrogenase subunit 3 family protein (plasmid) [Deinococcus psychrotolerans]|uniref:Gluconate 2-dehydrogenase subunit 3 family protein n=1 Tax=Deinococcus psychrotolerans TaxID=2489213 RepID=A0A3G8YS57_9DEIO|nr:gluconate 2-dehydrogenase subunit 3 family protein [Deinococcus psychrotolerans]AZI45354.1 gluconate 2-dehydrogenase subunit 3 family protein [Deinococcus psychrotolerans]
MDEPLFSAAVLSRREVLARMGLGLAALTISTVLGPLSPAQARVQGVPLKHFTPAEAAALEAWNDTLVPGAAEAGVVYFLDDQLSKDLPLLLLRYTDFPAPALSFYQGGIHALDALSQAQYQQPFAQLDAAKRTSLAGQVAQGSAKPWDGPPAPLFYFVTRSDAVDVYYGTEAGFARLKLPYMAHIAPPKAW